MMTFPTPLESATDCAIELLEQISCSPGDAFYNIQELAAALHLAPLLAEQTMRELLVLGRIERKGNEFIVARKKIVRSTWEMASFSQAMSKHGLTVTSRVLFFGIIEAPKAACHPLNLTLGQKVYLLHRVRSTDGRPTVIEQSFIPVEKFEELLTYDFAKNSLYQILDQKYGTRAANQSLEFAIESPTEDERNWLNLDADEPMLVLFGKTADQFGASFEYSVSKSSGRYICHKCSPELRGFF